MGSGNAYANWAQTQNESFLAHGTNRLFAELADVAVQTPELPRSSRREEAHSSVHQPVTTNSQATNQSHVPSSATISSDLLLQQPAFAAETHLHAIERVPSEGRGKAAQFIPIRFVCFNKIDKDDRLLLAFDAFVLSAALGRKIPVGKIIHGDNHATIKVKASTLIGEVRKCLDKIATLLSSPAPPDLVLLRTCAECEFQIRCRQMAIEKDDLSLLAGMSEKERKKLRNKDIFSITQLSYTFRPRRRPKRLRDKRDKYHHSLKALAIREKKIHIVGPPELKIEGTPVYLDVEGLPDRDFHYLIGIRIGPGETTVQHSLWAENDGDERRIWWEFLAILDTIEKPVLVHYGSYETSFLERMSEETTA